MSWDDDIMQPLNMDDEDEMERCAYCGRLMRNPCDVVQYGPCHKEDGA
jgi:hypothetical protein